MDNNFNTGHDPPRHVLSPAAGGVRIVVRALPRSAQSGIAGTRDGALLVRLNSAPVDGTANAELIQVIADAVGVPRRSVTIAGGVRSRHKAVHVSGLSVDQVRSKLDRACGIDRAG